ncbi:hypothetical protein HDU91_002449 [Kappamyces sp. JEL0680]|nr:hypothetical protein HDU91_002449 [Kappamyces sp. JEL0680]
MKRSPGDESNPSSSKKPRIDALDPEEIARKIKAKKEELSRLVPGIGGASNPAPSARGSTETEQKILKAKQMAAERMAQARAQKELTATIEKVHDEEVKAKGGLGVAYHPALAMQLDPKGRVSGNRNLTLMPKAGFSSTLANQKLAAAIPDQPRLVKKKEIKLEEELPDTSKNPYYDPSLKTLSGYAPQKRSTKASFKFVEPGKFIEQANEIRNQQHLEKLKQDIAEAARKSGMEKELELVANAGIRTEPPPAVEWWDAKLVANESYEDFDSSHGALQELINNIIQHPVPIEPPAEEGVQIAPKPLILTEKERKKLRRQNRLEAQREKQDKIRLGLLPQEQPRVTKANFMRVLGQEAILAPSMIEAEMARQVAEREQKHKSLNESRKLTEEEKKAKKDAKLREDTSVLAKQYKLTGVGIINEVMNLVIVEGGPKGMGAYKKLMLHRINWQERPDGAEPLPQPNECLLVWEGEVKNKSFRNFRLKTLSTLADVKEYLEEMKVSHYWNAAKTAVADEI